MCSGRRFRAHQSGLSNEGRRRGEAGRCARWERAAKKRGAMKRVEEKMSGGGAECEFLGSEKAREKCRKREKIG